MINTILFDLDGTLTDSGEGIINCAAMTLERYGIPVPCREEMRVFVGPPLNETFLRFGIPEEKIDEAIAIFRSRYIPIGKYENELYPNIPEMLAALKAKGYRLLVATSKPETTATEVLEHFHIAHYFDCICGALMDRSRNTKSEVIAYLLERYQDKASMIMVGDTEFDVIGATAHGIPTIGVAWGYGQIDKMINAGAKAIAASTDELISLIENC